MTSGIIPNTFSCLGLEGIRAYTMCASRNFQLKAAVQRKHMPCWSVTRSRAGWPPSNDTVFNATNAFLLTGSTFWLSFWQPFLRAVSLRWCLVSMQSLCGRRVAALSTRHPQHRHPQCWAAWSASSPSALQWPAELLEKDTTWTPNIPLP